MGVVSISVYDGYLQEMFVDGTFDVCRRTGQMVAGCFRHPAMKKAIPFFYAFVQPPKSRRGYDAIARCLYWALGTAHVVRRGLCWLCCHCSQLRVIHTDDEAGLFGAFCAVFPLLIHLLCQWHVRKVCRMVSLSVSGCHDCVSLLYEMLPAMTDPPGMEGTSTGKGRGAVLTVGTVCIFLCVSPLPFLCVCLGTSPSLFSAWG